MKKYFLLTMLMAFALGMRANNPQQEGNRDGDYYFDVNIHTYPNTMTYMAIIELDGVEQMREDIEIGFFVGDECRGREKPTSMYAAALGHYYVMFSLYGNDGDNISTFRLYDHALQQELSVSCSHDPIIFVTNGMVGDPLNPEVFSFTSVASYLITATANPTEGGIVTGGGYYEENAECTLTATANEGYTFVNWTKDGEVITTETTYTFTVTEAAAYVANFQINSYEITATANPDNAGTIAGAGTYDHFETCTLTATASEGYHFVNWTKDGEVVSTEANYSFTVTGPAAYVANFELNSYEITVSANPEEGGTVAGGGTFNHFETCTLTATANEGYHFVNWTKGGEEVSTEATYTFTVTETATYVANFELNSYEITATVNPEGSGVIIGAGVYDHGTTCTLSVVANPGYSFLNWTKNGEEVSTTESFSFVVTEPAAYVANFEIVGYEIVVTSNPEEGGTTTGGGVYVYGATATLTATANEGYHFVNWTMDGEEVTTETTYSFVVTESAAYVANFQINSYEITATANPTAGGTISGAGTYNHFASCTLIATVNEGYTFINWTKNGEEVSTELSFSFVVTEPAAYVANFQINSYTINATANPTVAGTITGAGVYDYGTAITLVATANEGYTFINWTKDGNVVSNSMSYNITVTEDADYVANFELNSYEITVSANPEAGGIVGTECTLTATPIGNYIFVNWSKDGVVLSTDAVYSFMVVEGGDYVATFAPNEFQITVSANPTNGGTVTGGGVYNYGTTATLTATARTGFTFVNWTKDGNVVSTDDTYSFTVTEAGYYVANFSRNDCVITAIADPADGGNITGAGTYGYGTACILTATPAPGYTFVNWTKDGQFVSSSATYHFAVTEDATYVAHFLHNQYYVTVTANPSNSGSVTGAGAYMYGETCTVTAFANTGYHFVRWTKNGTQVSTNIEYSFTVTENADVVGYFELNEYQITAVADPANAGTITGTGTYIHGSTATLTADANTGSAFVNWTKNGHIVSTNATYSFTVTESAEYVAHFTSSTHVVTTGAHPAIGGQVSGAGTYAHGASCTVVATPNEGYVFVKWMQGGVQVSTQPSYSFTVTENTHCTAYFVLQNCTITAEATPVEGGEVSGAGVFEYGETCTLEATPNENYLFVEWQKEGVQVSTDATYSFTVTEDAHYTAVFYYVDGVGEYNGMRVTLYPNPAKDKLMVETSEPINLFEIYSISGALVYRQKDCSDKIEVNVSNFSIGAYMIRLTTDSTVETRRFVKE